MSDQYFTMLLSLVPGRIYDKALRFQWQYIALLISYDQSFADFHIIKLYSLLYRSVYNLII